MSLCSMRSGSPSWRAMCTLRATSSHITAALTAAFGSLPIVNGPWLRMRTAGERPDGDLPAELVGHHGEHARDGLAPGRPRAGIRRVRVDDAPDLRHRAVD